MGFPGGSDGRESARNTGDLGSIPGLGRSPGEGNGNPLQYPYLENSMDRGAWQGSGLSLAKGGLSVCPSFGNLACIVFIVEHQIRATTCH